MKHCHKEKNPEWPGLDSNNMVYDGNEVRSDKVQTYCGDYNHTHLLYHTYIYILYIEFPSNQRLVGYDNSSFSGNGYKVNQENGNSVLMPSYLFDIRLITGIVG